jgi:hypothetical protein
MSGLVSIRKSGLLLFNIRRRMLVDAPRRVGELETLVMKNVRKTCDRGSTAEGAVDGFSDFIGCTAAEPETAVEMADAASVAGRSFGAEVWRERRLESRLSPSCTIYDVNAGDARFCTRPAEAASCNWIRRACFIVINRLRSRRDETKGSTYASEREIKERTRQLIIQTTIWPSLTEALDGAHGYLRPS